MNTFKRSLILSFLCIVFSFCSTNTTNKNTLVQIKTTVGDIKVRLYDETPNHRDNFIRLVNSRFYEEVTFHRVIKDFMIQAGDPSTKTDETKLFSDSLYTIPSEFRNHLFHKKGALVAARQGNNINPEMRSSRTQFYLVQGVKYTDEELNRAEQIINNNIRQAYFVKFIKEISDSSRISGLNLTESSIQEKASIRMFEFMDTAAAYKITEEHRNIYKNIGGVPRLDGTYTVFGEVVDGLDIIDKIASVKTDEKDRPLTDIKIIRMKLTKK